VLRVQVDLERFCRCLCVDLMLSTRDLHKVTPITVVQWLCGAYCKHDVTSARVGAQAHTGALRSTAAHLTPCVEPRQVSRLLLRLMGN